MADTPLTIANRALARLGVAAITGLDCAVDHAAVTMCTFYEPTLKGKLQEHRWNFTQIRAELTGWACVPVHYFSCAYVLPGDLLQIEETTMDETEEWRVESFFCSTTCAYANILVTDVCSPVGIIYTSYVTDHTRWSPLFIEAFVTELAALAAYPITRNATLQQSLLQEADIRWRRARSRDGQAGRTLKRWLSDVLLHARFSRSTWRDPTRLS